MASINEIHNLMTTARAEHPVASSAIAEFIQRISRQEKTATTVYASPLRLSPARFRNMLAAGWTTTI